MAIVLKYGAPGAILQSGFASGVGSRKNKQQEDLLKIWQQQTQQGFQAQQADLARQQQLGLQQNAQAFQANQQQDQNLFNLGLREDQQKFLVEQNRLNRNARAVDAQAARFERAGQAELGREQQLLLQRNAQEAIRARDTEEAVRKGEMELPPPVQQKLNQLESGLVDAMKLDPAQQQEFREKYEQEKRALLSMAKPRAATSPEEDFKKNTFTKDGTTYQRTERGFDVLKDPSKQLAEQQKQQEAEQKKVQERQQAVTSKAEKLYAEKDKLTGKSKYKSFGEALRDADAMQREADSFFSTTPQPQPESGSYIDSEGATREWARRGTPQATQIQGQTGQWGDGSHGEPVTQTFTGSTAGGPGTYGQPSSAEAPQQAPKSQDQILEDFTNKQEAGQLKADLPAPTPEQLASPVMGTKAELEQLPHGAVVGPVAGPDGNQYLYQWNAKAKKLVKLGPWTGKTPDRSPQKREQPMPEFAGPMY